MATLVLSYYDYDHNDYNTSKFKLMQQQLVGVNLLCIMKSIYPKLYEHHLYLQYVMIYYVLGPRSRKKTQSIFFFLAQGTITTSIVFMKLCFLSLPVGQNY